MFTSAVTISNQYMFQFAPNNQRSRSVVLDTKQAFFCLDDSLSELEPEFDIYTADQADSFQRFSQELLLEGIGEKLELSLCDRA